MMRATSPHRSERDVIHRSMSARISRSKSNTNLSSLTTKTTATANLATPKRNTTKKTGLLRTTWAGEASISTKNRTVSTSSESPHLFGRDAQPVVRKSMKEDWRLEQARKENRNLRKALEALRSDDDRDTQWLQLQVESLQSKNRQMQEKIRRLQAQVDQAIQDNSQLVSSHAAVPQNLTSSIVPTT